jgi:hypothetical protein
MKKTMLKFLMLFTVIALMSSCYPGDVSSEDLDTVTTLRTGNFTKPDKVVIWWGVHQIKDDSDDNIPYKGEIDEEILNTTLDNLVELYGVDNVYIFNPDDTPDPAPSKPVQVITPNDIKPGGVDLKVFPAIILKENISVGYYPPYWDPWYPWYPCWYCWYPPVYDISSYEVGTVLLGMIDNPWTISENDNGQWLAAIRGLISGSSYNGSRTVKGIDKAFDQSPYLK